MYVYTYPNMYVVLCVFCWGGSKPERLLHFLKMEWYYIICNYVTT